VADLSRQLAGFIERSATRWSALLVTLLFTLALAPAVYGSASSRNTWSQVVPRFEWGACPARVAKLLAEENASCGYLVVPENRTKANGRTIRLPVAIIPSVSRPSSDPIVYMAGGPGADALSETPTLVKTGLNKKRYLIVMNQRGNKDARPELTCPEINRFLIKLISLPYDADSTKALHLAATQTCHDRLVRKGIDLSAYNTTENSADFADLLKVLKKALKIKEWNVYGLSYGTNLALSYLRDHPEGIRSVIIDSVAPPSAVTLGWIWTNADEGIHNIFNACAAQPGCSHAFGDLADVFAGLVQQYEADPLIDGAVTFRRPTG
jgi:pimeloyl-ACP methyl ester carboxylesterase